MYQHQDLRAPAGRSLTFVLPCPLLPLLCSLPSGIGGSYMCIYPMDSPGGYQLVGRTLPIWNTFGRAGPFTADKPWLLEFFDQVRVATGSDVCQSQDVPLFRCHTAQLACTACSGRAGGGAARMQV